MNPEKVHLFADLSKYQACDAYYYHRRMDKMPFHQCTWLAAKN